MKWIKCIAIVCVTVTLTNTASAQLLKKLKEKAEKAIDGKAKNTASSSEDGNNTSANTVSSSSKSTSSKAPSGPPSNGNMVFSLAADEHFLHDESAITATNNGVNYQFVIRSKTGFYLVNNGTKTGPFKTAPIKSRNVPMDSESNYEISKGDTKDEVALQYTKTIGGKLHIVFNGKNYGPYDHVAKMLVSPDQKSFFAAVTIGGENSMTSKMGLGYSHIVGSNGTKQKIGTGSTMPIKFFASESFTHAMIVVMDQTGQQIFTVSTTGKRMESTMADMYSSGESKMFVSDKGDIISIPSQSPRQILVNGEEAAAFKVPIENISRLTITPDISKSVYYSSGKLYKANGEEVPVSGILFPKIITQGNITTLYYFKVHKNESGTKDVYLCKQEI